MSWLEWVEEPMIVPRATILKTGKGLNTVVCLRVLSLGTDHCPITEDNH